MLTCLLVQHRTDLIILRVKPADCLLLFCASELIKKHELEKDEPRPLYMDFQATTPMVTTSINLVITVKGFTDLLQRALTCFYSLTCVFV